MPNQPKVFAENLSVPVLRLPGYTCCLAWWTPVTGAGQSSV